MVSWLPSGRFQVKIVDFGLAKFSAKPSLQTIDHGDAVFGSIFFMAPEQFERTPLDRRTDMYSLGAMYYYALAGEYPFNGDTAPQVMAAHLQNKVAPLAEVRPDLPPWVCDWVMWHIRRDMSDRPESARSALEHFLAHDSAHTFGVTTSQPLQAAAPIATGTVNTQASALSGNTAPQPILSPSGQLSPQTAAQNIVATSAGNLNPISGATAPIPASTQAAVEQVIEQPVEVAPVVYSKPKVPKNVLILIGVVLLALIIMLMVFVLGNRGNASIQRINELSKQVDTKKHNSVIINDQDMGLLLNGFLNTDADASNTCGDILARAQAEGGTFNVDEQIFSFSAYSRMDRRKSR